MHLRPAPRPPALPFRQAKALDFLQSTALNVEPVDLALDADGEPPLQPSSSRPVTPVKATGAAAKAAAAAPQAPGTTFNIHFTCTFLLSRPATPVKTTGAATKAKAAATAPQAPVATHGPLHFLRISMPSMLYTVSHKPRWRRQREESGRGVGRGAATDTALGGNRHAPIYVMLVCSLSL